MYDTITAQPGAANQRLLMALLLRAKARIADGFTAAATLARRAHGFGADLAGRVRFFGITNVARAILATPLYWARRAALVAGPALGRLRTPAALAAALLASGRVRHLVAGLAGRLRQAASAASGFVAARLAQAPGLTGQMGRRVVAGVARTGRALNAAVRRFVAPLATRTAIAVQVSRAVAGTRVAMTLAVLAVGALAPSNVLIGLAVVAVSGLAWGARRTASPTSAAESAPLRDEPAVAEAVDGLSPTEIAGVYEAMLTLETALPEITAMLTAAADSSDAAVRLHADGLLAECRQQVRHLAELVGELRGKQPHSAAEAALTVDAGTLLAKVTPQLDALETRVKEDPSTSTAPNRATRRAATNQTRRQTKRQPAKRQPTPAAATA